MIYAELSVCVAILLLVLFYLHNKKIDIWLFDYLLSNFRNVFSKKAVGTKDILFLFVDHFELAGKKERLDAWVNDYPKLIDNFKDYDGVKPQHTWFSALDLINEDELAAVKILVDEGYGEVELHWHHSHNSSKQFEIDLKQGMEVFHKYGFMKPYKKDQHSCFSFIHGNWSLNNARGERFCGVNDEIEILKKYGCYGDFTFPALFSPAQPKYVNKISYTTVNNVPKSYDEYREATVGVSELDSEFMIMQGPLCINYTDWSHRWHPTFENGDINQFENHGSHKRIDSWVRQNIHVKGNPNWIFVKIFCHGAQDYKSITSQATYDMHEYLESKYNDGEQYRLHYVTARECYNIIKAAESGKTGNPHQYRDFIIPQPNSRG